MINRLINESCRPDDEVRELVEYVFAQIPGGKLERGTVAVKVVDGRGGGHAHSGPGAPRWQGRCRYSIYLTIPLEGSDHDCYGLPRVCWHSSKARAAAQGPTPDGQSAVSRLYDEWYREYDAGGRRFGRWPIYSAADWREHLIHITAHELAHIIAFDSARTRGRGSEVQCELFAERVLNRFRDLTNAAGIGMLRIHTDDPKEVTMSTEAPAAPAPPEQHGVGDSEHLDEALREEITPIKGATIVKAGGRKVDSSKAASSSTKKTSSQRKTGSTRKATSRKKTSSTGPKKLSALAAAEVVLKRAGGPLHVNEITKRIMAMPNTGLKGKTPEASVGAILAVNSKKRDSAFKRTAPSTYALKGKK